METESKVSAVTGFQVVEKIEKAAGIGHALRVSLRPARDTYPSTHSQWSLRDRIASRRIAGCRRGSAARRCDSPPSRIASLTRPPSRRLQFKLFLLVLVRSRGCSLVLLENGRENSAGDGRRGRIGFGARRG